jgi:hypothetical protein
MPEWAFRPREREREREREMQADVFTRIVQAALASDSASEKATSVRIDLVIHAVKSERDA